MVGHQRQQISDSNPKICKDTISDEFSLCSRKDHIHRITCLIDQDYRFWSFNLTNSSRKKFMLEEKIQDPSKCLFQFSFGNYVVDQRSGDAPFGGRCSFLGISCGQECSNFRNAGREDCFCSEQDHPEIHFKKKISLDQQKAHE